MASFTDTPAPENRHAAAWRKAGDFYAACKEVIERHLRADQLKPEKAKCDGCDCGQCPGGREYEIQPARFDRADVEALYEVAAARGLLATFEAAYVRVEKDIKLGLSVGG